MSNLVPFVSCAESVLCSVNLVIFATRRHDNFHSVGKYHQNNNEGNIYVSVRNRKAWTRHHVVNYRIGAGRLKLTAIKLNSKVWT
jgi:hypothetical protein